jgi:hypothetical protein
MPKFARKVLWIVSMSQPAEKRLLGHAQACGVGAVCIRTDNRRLLGAIGRFHDKRIKVYGWRWPAVKPIPGSKTHYYALDEAQYVAQQAIPAGLDGYIIDPESEANSRNNNWNNKKLQSLAHSFCATIRHAANEAGRADFVFGVTSGCDYATSRKSMPWAEFVAASDALFPQTYWRWTNPTTGKVQNINGGRPDRSIDKGLASWRKVANGKPIIPMAGEIDVIGVDEIPAYAAKIRAERLDFYHFYADSSGLSDAKCRLIKNI